MRQVEVMLHGHRVVCRVAGDPGLPVILLIHGITCSSATWDPVMPALAELMLDIRTGPEHDHQEIVRRV